MSIENKESKIKNKIKDDNELYILIQKILKKSYNDIIILYIKLKNPQFTNEQITNTLNYILSSSSYSDETVTSSMSSNMKQISIIPSEKKKDMSSNMKQISIIPSSKKKDPQRLFDINKYSRRRIALLFSYEGTQYHGLALQPGNVLTIEKCLWNAFRTTCLVDTDVNKCTTSTGSFIDPLANFDRCGRTDRGVHACGQVIALNVRSNRKCGLGFEPSSCDHEHLLLGSDPGIKGELCYPEMLNRVLPNDIRIFAWAPVPLEFSARFACKRRCYHYFFFRDNLDLCNMQLAASMFIGKHDFRNFCHYKKATLKKTSVDNEDEDLISTDVNFVRTVLSFGIYSLADIDTVERKTHNPDQLCVMKIVGQAFMWHQIRMMASVLFMIGHGLEQPSVIPELLNISLCPSRPIYQKASEFPLIFAGCTYSTTPELQWQFDTSSLRPLLLLAHKRWRQRVMEAQIAESIWKAAAHNFANINAKNPNNNYNQIEENEMTIHSSSSHFSSFSRPSCPIDYEACEHLKGKGMHVPLIQRERGKPYT